MRRWWPFLLIASCSSSRAPTKPRDAAPAPAPLPAPLIGPRVLQAVAGTEVLVWGAATEIDGEPLARIPVRADGTFTLDAIPDGARWIAAVAPGAAPVVAPLPRGVDPAEVFLPLGRCDDPYELVVVDARGRPVAAAQLTDELRDGIAFAVTDADGRVGACLYGRVTVRARGFAAASVETSGTVQLQPERTLRGTTRPGAIVEAIWYGEPDDAPSYFTARADTRGEFTLRGLRPGQLDVWVTVQGVDGAQHTPRVEVVLGALDAKRIHVPVPDLELHRVAIEDAAGPLRHTEYVVWRGKDRVWTGFTDAEGRALAPDGGLVAHQRTAGEVIDGDPVRHVLGRMPSLTGRVFHDGVPVGGAWISITGDGFSNNDDTDATGRFVAQMFRTGDVHVRVSSHQLGVVADRDLHVTDGFNDVDFVLVQP